jgi:hypothetical protein
LTGRPKSIAGTVKRVEHGEMFVTDEDRLVHYGHHYRRKIYYMDIEDKRRYYGPSKNKPVSKHPTIFYHHHPMPLVQPRKQN